MWRWHCEDVFERARTCVEIAPDSLSGSARIPSLMILISLRKGSLHEHRLGLYLDTPYSLEQWVLRLRLSNERCQVDESVIGQ